MIFMKEKGDDSMRSNEVITLIVPSSWSDEQIAYAKERALQGHEDAAVVVVTINE